jgi:hypothetical protein
MHENDRFILVARTMRPTHTTGNHAVACSIQGSNRFGYVGVGFWWDTLLQ